ncbi:DUF421 domain-containing protein [Fulvivirgaceae bacterium PWU5]|uniref:DUF421 domain-containing protein n=1 Tax=Dawidia cretensis TaxID=2782350 RepID=A0AAP2GP47_9BACT|nr:YetF domain-containing protein [Dawidia cretensis]MBT1707954.1 DUF421 domain-containing protein [Dawidia cretensis]
MKKEEIYLEDIRRILIGNAPPEFLLEVLVRTLIIYAVVLIVMRLLGKRMSGQVTLVEMALLVMLGAIIGSPIQIPDRGILTALIILVSAMFFHRLMNKLAYRFPAFERLTQGSSSLLVKNGVLQLEQMRKERVSTQQLFALLRGHQIRQLGQVKRVYLEAGGIFSVFRATDAQPGLAVFPPEDTALFEQHKASAEGATVCQTCGHVPHDARTVCSVCGNNTFVHAIR